MIHRKLWRDEFGVDMAEAVLKETPVTGSKFQNIHHVNVTARETPINPCRLQDVQFEGSIQGPRTVSRFFIS